MIIRCESISNAHRQVIRNIKTHHRERLTEYGEETWEYPEGITIHIHSPTQNMIDPLSAFKKQKCIEYANQLLEPHETQLDFDYTYHERIFKWGEKYPPYYGMDQIKDHVIPLLLDSPNSRRAAFSTWDPNKDTNMVYTAPCMMAGQFLVVNGVVNLNVLFRSEDMLLAFGPNAYALVCLLKYVSTRINMPIGTYEHTVWCPHIYYKRDASELMKWN